MSVAIPPGPPTTAGCRSARQLRRPCQRRGRPLRPPSARPRPGLARPGAGRGGRARRRRRRSGIPPESSLGGHAASADSRRDRRAGRSGRPDTRRRGASREPRRERARPAPGWGARVRRCPDLRWTPEGRGTPGRHRRAEQARCPGGRAVGATMEPGSVSLRCLSRRCNGGSGSVGGLVTSGRLRFPLPRFPDHPAGVSRKTSVSTPSAGRESSGASVRAECRRRPRLARSGDCDAGALAETAAGRGHRSDPQVD